MIVFKNYFKILKNYKGMVILYTSIFIFFAVIFSLFNSDQNMFEASKPNLILINKDGNTPLTEAFNNYIKENANIIETNNDDNIKDALFYREADMVLTIPKDFTINFMAGKSPEILMQRVPDSYNSTYAIMMLNRFLNIANVYVKANLSQDKIIQLINHDLDKEANVIIQKNNTKSLTDANYFYNYANYTVLAVCVLVISLIMSSFRNENISKRNKISPLSYKELNRSIFLGNLCMSFGIYMLYIIIAIILYKSSFFTFNSLLYNVNLLIFTFFASTVGFLVGSFVINKEAIGGIVNVIALGSSFICGSFVPQSMLSSSVLSFAKVLPSYWYIRNNDLIVLLSNYNMSNLKPILVNMGIIFAYALLMLIITNFLTKLRLKK